MKTRQGLVREALDGLEAPGEAALMLAAALREVYGGEWKITMSDKGKGCKGSFTIETVDERHHGAACDCPPRDT